MSTNKNTNLVAIITMCFIFAMISFVTNMGAPFGNIWGFKYEFAASWGNLMNFVAYLFKRRMTPLFAMDKMFCTIYCSISQRLH